MNTADGLGTTYTVLVGVDYSSLSALVLTEAVNVARARGRSHIHVVHVAPPPPEIGPGAHAMRVEFDEAFAAKAAAELRAYVQGIVGQGRVAFESNAESAEQWTLHVRFADADDAIVQLASDIEADLVVVGTHGHRGLGRLLLGSVAEGVVRLAPCPVLVVRPVGTIAAANVVPAQHPASHSR